MTTFNEQLAMAQSGMINAQQIVINLAEAIIDKPFDLAGNYFYVFDAPDQASYIQVRVNATNQPAISWVKQTGFMQPFTKLYITTPAYQTGNMTLLIASMAPELFSVIDNRSAISEAMNDVLDQLAGDLVAETFDTEITVGLAAVQIFANSSIRKAASLQAKSTNTGIVYLGTNNTVLSSKWMAELQPGMSFSFDDYRGPIWAIASAAGQLVGYVEW